MGQLQECSPSICTARDARWWHCERLMVRPGERSLIESHTGRLRWSAYGNSYVLVNVLRRYSQLTLMHTQTASPLSFER